jgi:hypothetical protein
MVAFLHPPALCARPDYLLPAYSQGRTLADPLCSLGKP